MAFTRISFDVMGERQVSRAFQSFTHEVSDMSEPLAEIGELLRLDVSEQFRTEGESGAHGKWTELNPEYARWKEQQVGDEPMLVFTGNTRAAMISRSAITVTPKRLIYRPDTPEYAGRHQTGEEHLPQRRMVDLGDTQVRAWERVFASWLNHQRQSLTAAGHRSASRSDALRRGLG